MREAENRGGNSDGGDTAEVVNQRLKRKASEDQFLTRGCHEEKYQTDYEPTRKTYFAATLNTKRNRAPNDSDTHSNGESRCANCGTQCEVTKPAAMQLVSD